MHPEFLLAARRQLRIAHHVPGRLRIRFAPALMNDAPELSEAAALQALQGIAGVRAVSLRRATLSLVIDYDPSVIPPETWDTIVHGSDGEAREVLASFLAA